jgi:hypothetical protein
VVGLFSMGGKYVVVTVVVECGMVAGIVAVARIYGVPLPVAGLI